MADVDEEWQRHYNARHGATVALRHVREQLVFLEHMILFPMPHRSIPKIEIALNGVLEELHIHRHQALLRRWQMFLDVQQGGHAVSTADPSQREAMELIGAAYLLQSITRHDPEAYGLQRAVACFATRCSHLSPDGGILHPILERIDDGGIYGSEEFYRTNYAWMRYRISSPSLRDPHRARLLAEEALDSSSWPPSADAGFEIDLAARDTLPLQRSPPLNTHRRDMYLTQGDSLLTNLGRLSGEIPRLHNVLQQILTFQTTQRRMHEHRYPQQEIQYNYEMEERSHNNPSCEPPAYDRLFEPELGQGHGTGPDRGLAPLQPEHEHITYCPPLAMEDEPPQYMRDARESLGLPQFDGHRDGVGGADVPLHIQRRRELPSLHHRARSFSSAGVSQLTTVDHRLFQRADQFLVDPRSRHTSHHARSLGISRQPSVMRWQPHRRTFEDENPAGERVRDPALARNHNRSLGLVYADDEAASLNGQSNEEIWTSPAEVRDVNTETRYHTVAPSGSGPSSPGSQHGRPADDAPESGSRQGPVSSYHATILFQDTNLRSSAVEAQCGPSRTATGAKGRLPSGGVLRTYHDASSEIASSSTSTFVGSASSASGAINVDEKLRLYLQDAVSVCLGDTAPDMKAWSQKMEAKMLQASMQQPKKPVINAHDCPEMRKHHITPSTEIEQLVSMWQPQFVFPVWDTNTGTIPEWRKNPWNAQRPPLGELPFFNPTNRPTPLPKYAQYAVSDTQIAELSGHVRAASRNTSPGATTPSCNATPLAKYTQYTLSDWQKERFARHEQAVFGRPTDTNPGASFSSRYLRNARLKFTSSRGNEYFCEIDEDYLTDRFNLTNLNTEVQYYQYALDLVTDVFDLDCEDEMREQIEKSARHLYGLIHARYIVTTRGLSKMLDKYKKGDFGKCPRVACDSQSLLPMGQHDVPNTSAVKLYCARCEDIYNPKSSRHAAIDGAYFGTSFHSILFQVYPALVPPKTSRRYEPKIYGFKVHSAAALARWQDLEREDMKARLTMDAGLDQHGFEQEDEDNENDDDDDADAVAEGIDDMFEGRRVVRP